MTERALRCPQCKAPLPASPIARSIVCPFCGSTILLDEELVQAAKFHAAFRQWNSPPAAGAGHWLSIGDSHWSLGALVGRGEVADVYAARRARWPSERALVKLLRSPADTGSFDHEWDVLGRLQKSNAPGATTLTLRLPQPIVRGDILAAEGVALGTRAMALRWPTGDYRSYAAVQRAYPQGIEARASIWVWRRILEVLSFVHASGFVHGAVLPPHLLIESGEHGVHLVGYRCADVNGRPLRVAASHAAFYAAAPGATVTLDASLDLAMSARCVAVLLGGDAASATVPPHVPAALAQEIERVGALTSVEDGAAWALWGRLGHLATEVFGAPVFCPLRMPEES